MNDNQDENPYAEKVTSIFKANVKKKSTPETTGVSFQVNGNSNIVGNGITVINTTEAPKLKIERGPIPGTIGYNSGLKIRIIELFNKIGDSRKQRFGDRAFPVLYSNFKKDFKIKNQKWSIIWDWPEECAPEIIRYLNDKFNNTIDGRISVVAKRPDYIHTRPHLYKKEKELLFNIGESFDGDWLRGKLKELFGETSHTKLTHLQHWQWVCHLEAMVKAQIGEK
jgi:hypothetical protein